MSIKKSLTKVSRRGIANGVKATCVSCKKSTGYAAKVVTLNSEKYCILPKSIYDGLLETIAIMSDPEAHKKLQEAFADPEKMMFDSVDDMLKHFGVERD